MSATPTLTVSVVVPSIGRGVLARVVGNALAQGAMEVLVVADAHDDVVAAVLAEAGVAADARVRLLAGPGRGVALARQAGLDAATGDVVLWLDDDVVPGPDLIAGHRRAHENCHGRVVVGYMPVAVEQVARRVTAVIYANDYESECRVLDADQDQVLRAIWAGNVSMRRTDGLRVPQAVDTFLEIPREDEEFGFRCLRAGFVGVFDRSLAAVHYYDRSVAGFLELAKSQVRSSRVLLEQYPDLAVVSDPEASVPGATRWLLRATGLPIVGSWLSAAAVAIAIRLDRGRPNRFRVRAAVFARAVVQYNAV